MNAGHLPVTKRLYRCL